MYLLQSTIQILLNWLSYHRDIAFVVAFGEIPIGDRDRLSAQKVETMHTLYGDKIHIQARGSIEVNA